MTNALTLLSINFAGLVAAILILWRVSVAIRDVSFIDAFWAFGMFLLAAGTTWQLGDGGAHAALLLGLTALWGLRLAGHLFLRWRAEGEDPRYAKIIGRTMESKTWSWSRTALLTVFLVQAPLLFITCLPVQLGIWASAADPARAVGAPGWLGVLAALAGIAFETVGDALTWWGLWLIAADTGQGAALASIIGPVFLTFTLTKWSGKALLEKGLHKTRPAYADYVKRTSGFIPWPPKKP